MGKIVYNFRWLALCLMPPEYVQIFDFIRTCFFEIGEVEILNCVVLPVQNEISRIRSVSNNVNRIEIEV